MQQDELIRQKIAECQRTNSKVLSLSGLGINKLPDEVFELSWLEELYLSNNNINYLPDHFDMLPCLRTLYCPKNSIKTVPITVCRLRGLRFLQFACNQLEGIPNELAENQSINVLNMRGNRLMNVCLSDSMINLSEICLSSNNLTHFPAGIPSNTRELTLSRNLIREIPNNLNKLTKLKFLNLTSNQIAHLPHFTLKMKLEWILLHNNLFTGVGNQFLGKTFSQYLDDPEAPPDLGLITRLFDQFPHIFVN